MLDLKGEGAREEMQNSFHPPSTMQIEGIYTSETWLCMHHSVRACTGLRQSPVRMLAYKQNKQASFVLAGDIKGSVGQRLS
jgi:hypothetical protein